jgi:hypothetical protein
VTPGSFDGGSWWDTFSVVGAFFAGAGQGVLNILNGAQDAVIGLLNLGIQLSPGGQIAAALGHPISVPSPDWSNGMITQESDGVHGWSKMIGGESLITLLTAGAGQIRHLGTGGEVVLNASSRMKSPPNLSGVVKYNRRIYNQFAQNNGRIIRDRSNYVFDFNQSTGQWEQVFGRFSEADNAIYLYAESNMSTLTHELIHYSDVSVLRKLGRVLTTDQLEGSVMSMLQRMGFTPFTY